MRRKATCVELSNVSSRWLHIKQRNSPLVPFLETSSIRRYPALQSGQMTSDFFIFTS